MLEIVLIPWSEGNVDVEIKVIFILLRKIAYFKALWQL